MAPRSAVVARALPWLVVLPGCGSDRVDTGQLEERLRAAVENRVGLRVSDVMCPESVRVQPHSVFTCKVLTSAGEAEVISVRQRDGHFSFSFGPR